MAFTTTRELAFQNNREAAGVTGLQDLKIHSPEILKLILQEERARSNRNRNEFSFILFDLKNLRNDTSMVSDFVRALAGRIRAIDKVGWMEDYSVGVVLPSTPSPGARILAEEIVRNRWTSDPRVIPYTIYTYPYTMYEM